MSFFTKLTASSMLKGVRYFSSEPSRPEIEKLIKSHKIVLFMKGVPEEPRCGFSNTVVQILGMHGADYESHDVLQSDELRQCIKEYSNWPTIPQIYIAGEFIGGCDIFLQMHQDGSLIEILKEIGIKSLLLEKYEKELSEDK